MESFDFDKFPETDDHRTGFGFSREQLEPEQVSSEAAPLEHEEGQPQPDQPMPLDSSGLNPKRESKKVNAVASADDSLEPQLNAASMPEDGQSKRIHLDSSASTDKLSSTVALPAPKVGTETQNQVSAATEGRPSISENTPTEGLDAWILRWTTLEQTELK